MTEGLLILTNIFVVYCFYVAVNKHKGNIKSQVSAAKPETLKATVQQPMHMTRLTSRVIQVALQVAVLSLFDGGGTVLAGNPQTHVTHFDADGGTALLNFSMGTYAGIVAVEQYDSTASAETFLRYLIIDPVSGVVLEDGAGLIPNSAFTVAPREAVLNVDTAAVPDFVIWSGTGGTINLTWKVNRNLVERFNGTTTINTPTIKVRESGQRTTKAATVNGTFLSLQLTNEKEAQIGTSSQLSVTIERPTVLPAN